MKRPAFQFYPADWRSNAKLRRCSEAARGAWMDILCLLHDSDEYGVCRWPLSDLARAAGVSLKFAKELAAKGVLKGGDGKFEAYVYTSRHAGKDGEPVTLIESGFGPCWYCSRFVRDEYVRIIRGAGTRFEGSPKPPPKQTPNAEPKPTFGGVSGYGASSASASAITTVGEIPTHTHIPASAHDPARARACVPEPHVRAAILLRKRGLRITPANPDLIAACREGVTPEALDALAECYPDKPAGYVIAAARRQHAQGAAPTPIPTARASPAPSKSMNAIQKLREVADRDRNRTVAQGRIEHRDAEADLPAPARATSG